MLPKSTFTNLPVVRQEEILQISLEEFTENSYEKASLNHIIKRCNIAKGSFYRYFNNKLELYSYLIDHYRQYNLELYKTYVLAAPDNLYESWKQYYKNVMMRRLIEPLPFLFLLKASRNRDIPELEILYQANRLRAIELLTPIFEQLQQNGKIRKDLMPKDIAYYFLSIQSSILDKMLIQDDRIDVITITEEQINSELDIAVKLITGGINTHEEQ